MLSTLALVALIAEPHAASRPTATVEVTQSTTPIAPPSGPSTLHLGWHPFGRTSASPEAYLDLSGGQDPTGTRTARARLGLDGTIGLGRFASALSSSFARWSIGIGFDATGVQRPFSMAASDNGLLVARLGHGLYLGHPPPVKSDLLTYREYLSAQPALFKNGVQLGMDGTLFITPHIGVRFNVSAGTAMYGGLSLVYRPGK
jgi:hypothetical protein